MSLDRQPTQKDCDHGRDRVDEGDIHGAPGHVCCSTEAHCAPPPLKFPSRPPWSHPRPQAAARMKPAAVMAACPCLTGWTLATSVCSGPSSPSTARCSLPKWPAGHLAGSQALKADALDFLADTVTYGLSLAVIGTTIRTRGNGRAVQGPVIEPDGGLGSRFHNLPHVYSRPAERGANGAIGRVWHWPQNVVRVFCC